MYQQKYKRKTKNRNRISHRQTKFTIFWYACKSRELGSIHNRPCQRYAKASDYIEANIWHKLLYVLFMFHNEFYARCSRWAYGNDSAHHFLHPFGCARATIFVFVYIYIYPKCLKSSAEYIWKPSDGAVYSVKYDIRQAYQNEDWRHKFVVLMSIMRTIKYTWNFTAHIPLWFLYFFEKFDLIGYCSLLTYIEIRLT